MTVKYQVERRPIGPTGQVYRGTEPGDYISVLTNPTDPSLGGASGMVKTPKALTTGTVAGPQYIPAGYTIPALAKVDTVPSTGGTPAKPGGTQLSHLVEVSGEPWLVHSTHFSVESALESAAPLAGAIGADNVRIIKVIPHSTSFNIK